MGSLLSTSTADENLRNQFFDGYMNAASFAGDMKQKSKSGENHGFEYYDFQINKKGEGWLVEYRIRAKQ